MIIRLPTVRRLCAVTALAGGALLARGADTPSGAPIQPKSGDFVFSLLPKSLQRNPDLEMTVNTEFTDYGRLLRRVTPQQPMYYMTYAIGYRQLGEAVGGEHSPPPAQLEQALRQSLAKNGFLPATREHAPSLVIFYFWGSHNRMDREMEAQFPELAAKYRLERAMLVGGHHEVDTMARVMQFGENLTDLTPQYEYLRDQIVDDLYYVVASAYDFTALTHKERKLVWRTTMTVNAQGVSMKETLTPLIATAAPYFGRETSDPVIAERRISRWGVIMGEPRVVEGPQPARAPQEAGGAASASPKQAAPTPAPHK
ncbi:MAG TPA: hypothetical protein VHE61_05675 [Opitutaceae bacterium]|nr:hypothetical protein [Opitutaceae bacterium]